jgi:hypothetical protein
MNGHAQLRVLPCPECGKVGTLDLCTKMLAPPTDPPLVVDGSLVLARAVDALVCTEPPCDFYRLSDRSSMVTVASRRV